MSQTRRLAAILAADVAGYSRLMGAEEEGTLERRKALRRELADPEHHGRPPGSNPGTKTPRRRKHRDESGWTTRVAIYKLAICLAYEETYA
jgi:hypothetical protein